MIDGARCDAVVKKLGHIGLWERRRDRGYYLGDRRGRRASQQQAVVSGIDKFGSNREPRSSEQRPFVGPCRVQLDKAVRIAVGLPDGHRRRRQPCEAGRGVKCDPRYVTGRPKHDSRFGCEKRFQPQPVEPGDIGKIG